MQKIMAIDYGGKRCGIAESDPLQIIASGLTTVATSEIHDFLDSYLPKEKIETVVIGLPLRLNNELSAIEGEIQAFVKKLEKRHPRLKIVRVDERFTSKLAVDAMIQGGVKKQKRRDKGLVDKISATLILQTYLDQKGR